MGLIWFNDVFRKKPVVRYDICFVRIAIVYVCFVKIGYVLR